MAATTQVRLLVRSFFQHTLISLRGEFMQMNAFDDHAQDTLRRGTVAGTGTARCGSVQKFQAEQEDASTRGNVIARGVRTSLGARCASALRRAGAHDGSRARMRPCARARVPARGRARACAHPRAHLHARDGGRKGPRATVYAGVPARTRACAGARARARARVRASAGARARGRARALAPAPARPHACVLARPIVRCVCACGRWCVVWPLNTARTSVSPHVDAQSTSDLNAASEDRTHDLRIMRPTRCQLRYSRLNVCPILPATQIISPPRSWRIQMLYPYHTGII